MHALRDCYRAREVWDAILDETDAAPFYGLVDKEWVAWMLKARVTGRSSTRWTERMMTVVWLQWKWRNSEIFEGTRMDLQQRLRLVIACLEEDKAAFEEEEKQAVALCGPTDLRSTV